MISWWVIIILAIVLGLLAGYIWFRIRARVSEKKIRENVVERMEKQRYNVTMTDIPKKAEVEVKPVKPVVKTKKKVKKKKEVVKNGRRK